MASRTDAPSLLLSLLGLFAVAVLGLAGGALVGLLGGLVVTAAIFASGQWLGNWQASMFWPSVGELGATLFLGFTAGIAGSLFRNRPMVQGKLGGRDSIEVRGPHGLLNASIGVVRLEEEVERARYAHDPLTVVRFAIDVIERTPTVEEQSSIYRTVVRTLESTLHVIDVPFAYHDDDLAIIMPETDASAARVRMDQYLTALDKASFVHRPSVTRVPFSEYASVRLAIVAFPEDGHDAESLLATAMAGVQELHVRRGFIMDTWAETGGSMSKQPAEHTSEPLRVNQPASGDIAAMPRDRT